MLLLDVPKKKIVNDASRATSRVAGLDIKAVTPETLTDLLGLPGMRVVQFAVEGQDEQKYLHLFCEHCHEVAICPRCGQAMVGGYDSKDRSVRHLDLWEMRTIVHCGASQSPESYLGAVVGRVERRRTPLHPGRFDGYVGALPTGCAQ